MASLRTYDSDVSENVAKKENSRSNKHIVSDYFVLYSSQQREEYVTRGNVWNSGYS